MVEENYLYYYGSGLAAYLRFPAIFASYMLHFRIPIPFIRHLHATIRMSPHLEYVLNQSPNGCMSFTCNIISAPAFLESVD